MMGYCFDGGTLGWIWMPGGLLVMVGSVARPHMPRPRA